MIALPDIFENFSAIPGFLREFSTLVCVLCDENGLLLDGNCGFLALSGHDQVPSGPSNVAGMFVNPTFSRLAGALPEGDVVYQGILNIGLLESAVHSFRGTVYRCGNRLLVVAEPDIAETTRLNASMIELNAEMAGMQRSLVRKNQLLAHAQCQLVQAEKMSCVGQLAAGMAHEINNPIGFVHSNLVSLEGYMRDLFTILEACGQVERDLPASASVARLSALCRELDIDFLKQDIPLLLEESREGISRVKKIVRNLRDFTHIDSEDGWHWETPQHCLDTTLGVLRGAIPDQIEVIREYGEVPEIECLPAHLNLAFMNILLNAAQSIAGAGAIRVRTGRENGQVWVEIGDSGCGIAPEALPRIFEPFFTTRPVGSGTGLGLSAAFSIVERHHGRIEVESTPGQGTQVRIRLPIKQPLAADKPAS